MTQLMLLGLIKSKAMSGYEIKQYLNLSHAEKWAGIQTGSIYYNLSKLEKEGLIEVESVEHTGNRSSTIYSITAKGKEVFKKQLIESFIQVDANYPSRLYTSITFLGELTTEEAAKAINKQILVLEKELEEWENGRKLKEEALVGKIPDYITALFDNGSQHIKLNIEFLEEIKKTLPSNEFDLFLPPLDNNESGEDK